MNMTEAEFRVFREASWDSGWNAALTCAINILRSRIASERTTREEFAQALEAIKCGAASKTQSEIGDGK